MYRTAASNLLYSLAYAYDVADMITRKFILTGSLTNAVGYGYDSLYRLTSETTGGVTTAYGYDLAGNRTNITVSGASTIDNTFDAFFPPNSTGVDTSGNLTNIPVIKWAPDVTVLGTNDTVLNSAVALLHELVHFYNWVNDADGYRNRKKSTVGCGDYHDEEEKYVITTYEATFLEFLKQLPRPNHLIKSHRLEKQPWQ